MRGGGGYGFSYKGSGGTDGGDGEEGYSAPGGNGAGEDISDYNTFLAFSLSPGAGGQYVGNLYGGAGEECSSTEHDLWPASTMDRVMEEGVPAVLRVFQE